MTADLLLQAETLVDEFCQKLDQLVQQARPRQKRLEAETRQLRRLLDEIEVRLRLAQENKNVGGADAEGLQAQLEQLRQDEQQALDELAELEEECRRLELLLRQVAMSGRALRREFRLRPYDPWELALRSQVLYGREQERSALAREVHDGPAQVLSNAAMGLERLRQMDIPEQVAAPAELLLHSVRSGLQEVRRFIYDLRPSPLADEPLSRQIERYVRDLEASYQIEVELRWGTCPRELSAEEKVAAYRITQEALQNARKHAGAARIWVEAYVEPNDWVIAVSDDGVGFEPEAAQHLEDHWGIRGMVERARLIGADLQINSQPGRGTTVLVRLPLHLMDRMHSQERTSYGERGRDPEHPDRG